LINHRDPGAAEPQPKYFTQRRKGAKKNLEPQMNADKRGFLQDEIRGLNCCEI
jgi:hypothetical protein